MIYIKLLSLIVIVVEAQKRRPKWGICPFSLPKEGHFVKLTNSETVLKSELSKVGYRWENEMTDMLGKVFEVLPGSNNDHRVVAFKSPNGEQNGKWYFPKIVVSCHQCDEYFETKHCHPDVNCRYCDNLLASQNNICTGRGINIKCV